MLTPNGFDAHHMLTMTFSQAMEHWR